MKKRLLLLAVLFPTMLFAASFSEMPSGRDILGYQSSEQRAHTIGGGWLHGSDAFGCINSSFSASHASAAESLSGSGCAPVSSSLFIRRTYKPTIQSQARVAGMGVAVPLAAIDGSHSIATISARPYVAGELASPAVYHGPRRTPGSTPPPPVVTPDKDKQITPIGDAPWELIVLLAGGLAWGRKRRRHDEE